jgi:tRNA1(Val) A37 N6-methylase TrmN6
MPNKPILPPPDETGDRGDVAGAQESRLLGGRVRLLQPKDGYRAGMDAALLAAALGAKPGERILEAGCGPGAALLQAACRAPEASYVGVERDQAALNLARRNIVLNGFSDAVEALGGDVEAGFRALGKPPFDAAFTNPPFFDDPTGLRGPSPAKRAAWLADGGLEAWARFLLKAVRDGGRIIIIHRADRLADILRLLGAGAGSFRIRPVQPFADQPSKRVLVRALKTGRAPLVLLPPLVMHQSGGGHTAEAEAILRGESSLDW